jgi:membrane-bound lytic murein transglycosylase MltF
MKRIHPSRTLLLALLAALLTACGESDSAPSAAPWTDGADAAPPAAVARLMRPWSGDLPGMRERQAVRVLVTYDKTNFFFRDGRPRGFEYEMLRRFERQLNAGLARGEPETHLVFLPVPFEELLTALEEGRGDIAAAGLTITPSRLERVAFSAPYLTGISEIFVTSPAIDPAAPLEELLERPVVVARGTSYVRHLRALGDRLGREVRVVTAEPGLQSEDILEMVAAGAVDVSVVDEHIAEIWSRVYRDLVLRPELRAHEGSEIAWAVRRDSPQLRDALSRFAREHRRGTLLGNVLFRRYYDEGEGIDDPLDDGSAGRLRELEPLFRKYGAQYDFDWLAIAAQAYAESGLRQDRRSRAGAIGVMQLLPSTAAGRAVGIPDIGDAESNIHAGVKYMDHLRGRFSDDGIGVADAFDFALAAYNAGPRRVQEFRRRARERGLDANRWFRNVELAALEMVGRETVQYVAKVNKYYVAYRVAREAQRLRRSARGRS